jgi:OmpR family response regulator RpaB
MADTSTLMGTVLVVEDEVLSRELRADLLVKDGREIVTASDGEEALECLSRIPRPSLVMLDLTMPRMDGGILAASVGRSSDCGYSGICPPRITS